MPSYQVRANIPVNLCLSVTVESDGIDLASDFTAAVAAHLNAHLDDFGALILPPGENDPVIYPTNDDAHDCEAVTIEDYDETFSPA